MTEEKCKKCQHDRTDEGEWFSFCEACIFEECRQVKNNFEPKEEAIDYE